MNYFYYYFFLCNQIRWWRGKKVKITNREGTVTIKTVIAVIRRCQCLH